MSKLIKTGEKRSGRGRKRIVLIAAAAAGLIIAGGVGGFFFMYQFAAPKVTGPSADEIIKSASGVAEGDSSQAVTTLDKALEAEKSDTKKADLYSAKATILANSGDEAGAAIAARAAAEAAPSESTYATLGLFYAAAGNKDAAISAYKKALAAFDEAFPGGIGPNETRGREYYVDQITGLGGSIE